ncbi:hypothetical protein, conserved [Eimeria maxima]|uniref:Uncharacterized protein n=1 Tax=Eimeria maxima TaxID=5804 RepID=U6M4V1_EIMMA|nr:hypothetical protein, conserved [Eimeria maxima]CDJ58083.1 hypothetical protein, conserved [Eimeria maxima]
MGAPLLRSFKGAPREKGPPPSLLHAKGRPGGGGGVGPKKKTAQQKQQHQLQLQKMQQKQQQQGLLGGFAKHKKAKKAKEADGGPLGTKKGTAALRAKKKKDTVMGAPPEGPLIEGANLEARDLPYDMVSDEVFEGYKLFGRLCDRFVPHGSLFPSLRLFIDRLFTGYSRYLGITEDQFKIRVEYEWRFILPLKKDPLAPDPKGAPEGAPEGAPNGAPNAAQEGDGTEGALYDSSPFDSLDERLCQAWAAKRGLTIIDEETAKKAVSVSF